MTDKHEVETDERSLSVAQQSQSLAYQVMSYLLLIDVMYRSFRLNEAAWDLMAIVLAGGAFALWKQGNARILSGRHIRTLLMVAIAAMIVAAVIVLVLGSR